MMILLLAAMAAQAPSAVAVPIQARIVGIDERRKIGEVESYDRVRIEFTNKGAVPVPLRLCPHNARFENAYVADGKPVVWTLADTAFATSIGRQHSWRTTCRELMLTPHRSQAVNIFTRDGRTFGNVRRLNLQTGAGAFVFTSPIRFAGR